MAAACRHLLFKTLYFPLAVLLCTSFLRVDSSENVMCPSVCSCLGSFVDCSRNKLDEIPDDLPHWVEIFVIIGDMALWMEQGMFKSSYSIEALCDVEVEGEREKRNKELIIKLLEWKRFEFFIEFFIEEGHDIMKVKCDTDEYCVYLNLARRQFRFTYKDPIDCWCERHDDVHFIEYIRRNKDELEHFLNLFHL